MARGNVANLSRGRADQRPREGRVQRAARRLLIARNGGPITTREVVEHAWPGDRLLRWQWRSAIRAIERYADRANLRKRPLHWGARPGLLLAATVGQRR
jgi:hypothetical protein